MGRWGELHAPGQHQIVRKPRKSFATDEERVISFGYSTKAVFRCNHQGQQDVWNGSLQGLKHLPARCLFVTRLTDNSSICIQQYEALEEGQHADSG